MKTQEEIQLTELSGGQGTGGGGVEVKRELTVSKCPKLGRPKRAGGNLIYVVYIHIAFCTLAPQDMGISFLGTPGKMGNSSSNLFASMATKMVSSFGSRKTSNLTREREGGEMREFRILIN